MVAADMGRTLCCGVLDEDLVRRVEVGEDLLKGPEWYSPNVPVPGDGGEGSAGAWVIVHWKPDRQ